jgi:WD40 repeat protein
MTCSDYCVKLQQLFKPEMENLLALVNDASRFVRYFGMAIARSAPHIYISALPFAPTSSHIVKHYLHLFPHTLSFERGQLSHWPTLEMAIQAHDGIVWSVAFSPDGQRIGSASADGTICVLDAATGEVVARPFTGHTDGVNCVAFSPDGRRIASASTDDTIRVWDAVTGEVVAGPFTGHTNLVRCVAFSPSGQHIASASYDRTIRVWDASTGEVVAGPFAGHTDWVYCVAFSPDGNASPRPQEITQFACGMSQQERL